MIALYDQELRAELRGCRMTRRERAALQAELARAIAAQAEIDRAVEGALRERREVINRGTIEEERAAA